MKMCRIHKYKDENSQRSLLECRSANIVKINR